MNLGHILAIEEAQVRKFSMVMVRGVKMVSDREIQQALTDRAQMFGEIVP